MDKFPPNVRSVKNATEYITRILGHDGIKISAFSVIAVTRQGNELTLRWDAKSVKKKATP